MNQDNQCPVENNLFKLQNKRQVIDLYKSLSPQRKQLVKQLLQHPCSWCEKEFNIPNVGNSHGICERHKVEVYAGMGKSTTPNPNNRVVDLKKLSPTEINLAVELYKIIQTKRR